MKVDKCIHPCKRTIRFCSSARKSPVPLHITSELVLECPVNVTFYYYIYCSKQFSRAGRWLRKLGAHAALLEDPGSSPRTHRQFTSTWKCTPRVLTLLWPLWACMHVVHRHTCMQVNTYTHNKNKCKEKLKTSSALFLLTYHKRKKNQTNSFFWDLKTQLFYSGINMFVNWKMLWLFFLVHIPWIRFKQTTLISVCAYFCLVQVSWFLPSPTEHLSYSIQAAVR